MHNTDQNIAARPLRWLGVLVICLTAYGCSPSNNQSAEQSKNAQESRQSTNVERSGSANAESLASFLEQGRTAMSQRLCSGNSDFQANSNQGACVAQVQSLFDECVNVELEGVFVDPITNVEQAQATAKVIDECIRAYNAGPEAIKSYRRRVLEAMQR